MLANILDGLKHSTIATRGVGPVKHCVGKARVVDSADILEYPKSGRGTCLRKGISLHPADIAGSTVPSALGCKFLEVSKFFRCQLADCGADVITRSTSFALELL